jgi:hypothetical protein
MRIILATPAAVAIAGYLLAFRSKFFDSSGVQAVLVPGTTCILLLVFPLSLWGLFGLAMNREKKIVREIGFYVIHLAGLAVACRIVYMISKALSFLSPHD